jgi:hypothetical protein
MHHLCLSEELGVLVRPSRGLRDIYPGRPAKNIWGFTMKVFFPKKSKIGHGGSS